MSTVNLLALVMARGNTELPLPTRAAIVTLRYEGKGWTYISETLANCSPNGVQTFFERVLQRSQSDPDALNLPLLLRNLEDAHREGHPERFPEGSVVSEALAQVATIDEDYQDMPHKQIIEIVEEQEGVRILYATGFETLQKEEIVKRVPPRKIRLTPENKEQGRIFAEWALGKLQLGTIFIFSNEMSIESDYHRKRPKVSRPLGANPFDYARPSPNEFRSVMIWGAICEGFGPGPFHIWEKETPVEKAGNTLLLAAENKENEGIEQAMRERSRIEGTTEHQVLAELNANVRRLDREDPLPSGYGRRQRRPEWEFKIERAERGEKGKGGIDWLRYRELILKPLLYPWAEEISRLTGRTVYVVEDNASPHKKAKRLGARARARHGGRVQTVEWPPHSPDLNRIERCWDPIKDTFEKLRAQHYTNQLSEKAIRVRAKDAWYAQSQETVDAECRRFKSKLIECRDSGGNNNFYG